MSLLLSLMTFVSACQSISVTDGCSWVQVITVSRQDVLTDQTAREIVSHNEKVEKFCRP